ncbi:MAG TPA: sn-glycerol-3-phosphate ABC transporter ATP-binding protein UgpC [Solirubrobacteraceae bacterium]|jgi:multiple sugar transport system ATP-binding protein
MATITLEHVTKVYPNGAEAVSDLNLHVEDGEFMILVGPSGCGKTTALRMVAGLEDVTDGNVEVGGRVVNDLSPRERDIAMVFQNYALYPHMTVGENIGFALRLRRLPKAQMQAKVNEAAEILGLTEHLKRKPAQLSGGQRQRVAMGRAIVREPAAFLMDEPLSNLDAKLRVQMRAEVSRIQRRVGVATLYVTHDQTEAMTMGDRVAVMRSGRLQQCDTPQALYDSPINLFVAAFMGSPAMNLYHAQVDAQGATLKLGDRPLALPQRLRGEQTIGAYRGKDIVVGIRPEDLTDAASASGQDGQDRRLEGTVDLIEALGAEKLVHFHIDASRLQSSDARIGLETEADTEGLASGEIGAATMTAGVARVSPASRIKDGEKATFLVATERMHLFDPESGNALSGA